jgi:ABC-type transporter Mla subunit MlaD
MDHADASATNVNTTIDQLRDPIQQDLAQLRSTMEKAESLIGSIQSVVRGNDDNIRESIDKLRIASENLAQLTDHVNHQPWSLVRIRKPKDRKVPK